MYYGTLCPLTPKSEAVGENKALRRHLRHQCTRGIPIVHRLSRHMLIRLPIIAAEDSEKGTKVIKVNKLKYRTSVAKIEKNLSFSVLFVVGY